jgi:hypothetical protein
MPSIKKLVAAALAALAGLPCVATEPADEPAPAAAVAATQAPAPEAEPPVTRPNPLGAKPLDRHALAFKRGGTQVLNDMKLRGVVADNQASNLTTGNNLLSDGAFSGAAGLPMVIQNSGNNVLIQNATIVNVQVK